MNTHFIRFQCEFSNMSEASERYQLRQRFSDLFLKNYNVEINSISYTDGEIELIFYDTEKELLDEILLFLILQYSYKFK